MKKIIMLLFGCMLILLGCSSTGATSYTYSEENLIPTDQIDDFYASPDDFTGQSIALNGQVFQEVGPNGETVDFQIYSDITNWDGQTYLYVPSELANDINEDDYVTLTGVVLGSVSFENAMGAEVTVPAIQVETIEETDYMNAVVPALSTVEIDETKTESGVTVTVDKVEFAATETRVYVTVKNETGDDLSMPGYDVIIKGDSSQYVEQTNFDGDYPEFDTTIADGVEQSAILTLEAIDPEAESSLTLTLPFYIYNDYYGDVEFSFTIK